MIDTAVPVFAAKYARPIAAHDAATSRATHRLREQPLTVLAAPPGYADLAGIAAVVGDDALWVWLDEFDDEPASLTTSIANGVRHRVDANTFAATAVEVQARDDIVPFGSELGDALAGRTLVLASAGRTVSGGALALLSNALVPAMATPARVLVVSDATIAPLPHDVDGLVIDAEALRLRPDEIDTLAGGIDPSLTPTLVRRAARLAEGRGATLASVLMAGSLLGQDAFDHAVKNATSLHELLVSLVSLSLHGARPDVVESLHVIARLGFVHPRLLEATLGQPSTLGAPWLLALEDGWARSDSMWRAALPAALRHSPDLARQAVSRLADRLLGDGAPELALALCRELGDVRMLARCLAAIADRPDAARRWAALEGDRQATRPVNELRRVDGMPANRSPHAAEIAAASRRWRRIGRYLRRPTVDMPPPVGVAPVHAVEPVEPVEVVGRVEVVGPVGASAAGEASEAGEASAASAASADSPAACVARLLGHFEFTVDGTAVDAWAGTRGRSILKYLVVHRERPVRKETLMETFWPGGEPDASRNSLNVALSSLRRTLRPLLGDVPVIVHRQGSYQFNPAVNVRVDVEAFERSAIEGLRNYASGDFSAATAMLSDAVTLYRGAFFEDDPFEEWTSAAREHLRVLFLDALDRLGEIAFTQGRYDTCVEVGHKILAEDCCREDTHRRLMRCHARQGRAHLALRQYHRCTESLRNELVVDPSAETIALFEAIRTHQAV